MCGIGKVVDYAEGLVVVLNVLQNPQADLLLVADAGGLAGLFAGLAKTGNRMAARIAIMAITTSSSISVKPLRFFISVSFKLSKSIGGVFHPQGTCWRHALRMFLVADTSQVRLM